jgi:hypothetical protein
MRFFPKRRDTVCAWQGFPFTLEIGMRVGVGVGLAFAVACGGDVFTGEPGDDGGAATGGAAGTGASGAGGKGGSGAGGDAVGGASGSAGIGIGGRAGAGGGGGSGGATGAGGYGGAGGAGGKAGAGGSGGAGGSAGRSGAAGTAGAGGSGGAPVGELLVGDGTQNNVYRVDLTGHVFAVFVSPVGKVRGVAYDRRARDGFWVCGQSEPSVVYKVQWTGGTSKVTLTYPLNEVRGLDHYVAPDGADLFAMVGINTNNIDVFNTWRVSDGSMQMSSGQVVGTAFQTGFWGVRAVGPPDMSDGFDRWMSRNNGTIEHWLRSSTRSTIATTMLGPIRGLDTARDGTFWVVASTKIVHTSADGATLNSFPTPAADAMGLSYQE